MRRVLEAHSLCILGVCIALGSIAARGDDMAPAMPCDTALYLGWSGWVAPDAPELRAQQKLLAAVAAATSESGESPPGAAWIVPLFDLLEPLQTGSVGLGLFDVTLHAGTPEIDAALVVTGPDAARLPAAVHDLFVRIAGAEHIDRHEVREVALECVRLEGLTQSPVWGLHKEHFILALGDAATGKVIDCLEGRAPSLVTVEEFAFDRQKIGARADGRHFCLYVDVQRVVTRGKELALQALGELPPTVDQVLDELGITAVRSKYVHVDELDGRPRMAAFAHVSGPLRGLLKIWDQPPLSDDDLRIVPQDAYWALVTNLDLAALWEEAQRVLEALAPDQRPAVDGTLAMSTRMLGFSLTDELLPALGDTWALFDARDHGGLLLSGTVFVAELKDVAVFQRILNRVIEMAAPLATAGNVTLKAHQTTYAGHTIQYLLLGGQPVPVAPAWSFVGNRWVLGLFPQTVGVALKQVDPQTRGESLLDQPDFKAARAKLPKDAQGICYVDSRYAVRLLYPFMTFLQTAGVSVLAKHGAEIDLALLPPLPESVAGITNYVGATAKDADGVLYASVGSGAPLPIVAGGAGLATSILLPSLARSRELAKRAVSASNLRGIGQACHVWAADHNDSFPATLEQLLETGLVTQKMLRSPRDPRADGDLVSYVLVTGQTARADVQNVLAYERLVDNEGTNILSVDGHVEWMKPDAFKAAVRETYQRLGRESDLPSEFRE